MRGLSKLRRLCRVAPLHRLVGDFVKPDEDAAEPERTERLLAAPLTLFHSNGGDSFDALSLFWLTRATGGSAVGVFYDMACFLVMLSLAVVFGLGSVFERLGPDACRVQAALTVTLQLGLAAYIIVLRPSIDRLCVAQLRTLTLKPSLVNEKRQQTTSPSNRYQGYHRRVRRRPDSPWVCHHRDCLHPDLQVRRADPTSKKHS